MLDTYPSLDPDEESGRSGASKVNEIVYRNLYRVLETGGQSGMPNPASQSGRVALSRLQAMADHGVEEPRLAVLSGLAHIDSDRRAEAAEVEAHAEIAAIMEEAPGA